MEGASPSVLVPAQRGTAWNLVCINSTSCIVQHKLFLMARPMGGHLSLSCCGTRWDTGVAVRGQRGVMPDPSLGLDCVMGRDGDAAGDLRDG